MAKETVLNSVEEVIEDFRIGKPVIVVDDEDRENEGDFIVAASRLRSPRRAWSAATTGNFRISFRWC